MRDRRTGARSRGRQPEQDPSCRACGLPRDKNVPIPKGWTVHLDRETEELYVVCSDACRDTLSIAERRAGPQLDDLFAGPEPERKSVLEPGPDLDDLF